jgi:nicotinamide-nucleotide amidase
MNAILLSIGDELTLGQTVDTNAAWLSERLARRGIMTVKHITVADVREMIVDAFGDAITHADLVIATGGLGPTEDDLTRFAIADVMGVGLERDAKSLEEIATFFRGRGRTMVERNKIQADCPIGATMLTNPAGTAPGIYAEIDGTKVWSVPGVPREMRALWELHIQPEIEKLPGAGRTILTTKINTFGTGESDVAERLGDLMARDRNPMVGTTVANGIVSARIRSEFPDPRMAEQKLAATVRLVEQTLGDLVFGRDEQTLAEAVGAMLKSRGLTLSTAESCTGGWIGKMLTDTPGSSLYYDGGWIVYNNEAKERDLRVPVAMIHEHGAVSEPVAKAMAEGALRTSGADLAVAVTGIAGPDGGTDDKPVGTVCFGLAQRDHETISDTHLFAGDREHVRLRTCNYALNLVRRRLME